MPVFHDSRSVRLKSLSYLAADADRRIGELAAQTANPPVAAQPLMGQALSVRG